jgi:hypothetical protein
METVLSIAVFGEGMMDHGFLPRRWAGSEMTIGSLNPTQKRTLMIIRTLFFGRIEGLSIHAGQPCYDPAPRIIQEIKLSSPPEQRLDDSAKDLLLKKEFAILFRCLSELREGIVAIDVRHGAPFKLELERRHVDLVSPEARYV